MLKDKLENIIHKGMKWLSIPLIAWTINTNADNISGRIENAPERERLYAEIILENSIGEETKTRTDSLTGEFSMDVPAGIYKMEVKSNNHYLIQNPSVQVNGNTDIGTIQLIKGKNPDGTPILESTYPAYNGSVLLWTKLMKGKLDDDIAAGAPPYHSNWETGRRRLYVSGITGQSRTTLNYVKQFIQNGTNNEVYYDEQPTDSTIGISLFGVPGDYPRLNGARAYTYPDSFTYITPLYGYDEHVTIYIANDQGDIWAAIFCKEFGRAEVVLTRSLDPIHLFTAPGTPSQQDDLINDELRLIWLSQVLKVGTDWRNFKDTIPPNLPPNAIRKDEPQTIDNYVLEQNYPNPFNNATTFLYSVPKASQIKIDVYDIQGKL
ncbi:MAG: hypothetical protein HXY50_17480, partial [Ignavibacteriaceae bacterium]|nr:hypothetical protein [Ignavibacteriaceae bacterium]